MKEPCDGRKSKEDKVRDGDEKQEAHFENMKHAFSTNYLDLLIRIFFLSSLIQCSQSSLAVRFTAKNGGYLGDVKI